MSASPSTLKAASLDPSSQGSFIDPLVTYHEFKIAVKVGNQYLVNRYIEENPLDASNREIYLDAIGQASMKGHVSLVGSLLVLLGEGVDIPVNQSGHTPLYLAATYNQQVLMDNLIEWGADTKKLVEETDAFQAAITNGHVELVTKLIALGADINQRLLYNSRPLDWSITLGRIEVARVLIDAGAEVNYQMGDSRDTPLICAARKNHASIIHRLIEAGADYRSQIRLMKSAARTARTSLAYRTIVYYEKRASSRRSLALLLRRGLSKSA